MARIIISSGEELPSVDQEIRQAVVDRIRGSKPTGVPTGVLSLLVERHGTPRPNITAEAAAGLLGHTVDYVDLTLGMLVREELAIPVVENQVPKFTATAPIESA
jgi:hypothetical protein